MIKFSKTNKKYGCFSNFYPCTVEYEGISYPNSECAWQSLKTFDMEKRAQFATCSAAEAKKMGRRVELRPDWEDVKYQLMVDICLAKFSQNEELKNILCSTGDEVIVENTTGWHDNLWGNCECERCKTKEGQNLLGKALMEVRSRLKAEVVESAYHRDINRIPTFLNEIKELWEKHCPQYRFGQIIFNFNHHLEKQGKSMYCLEEDDFLMLFKEYIYIQTTDAQHNGGDYFMEKKCTLENCENRRNHFAHAALSAVADCPLGDIYNPLYIWAEEKDQEEIDYLLQAFLNSVTDKKVRVLRISEMCGFILDAIRKTLEASDLSSYSSHKLVSTLFDEEDIVVLKDAQHLQGEYKFSMQMEVARIINHLVTNGKQILLLSSIPLSKMPYLQEKLRMMCPRLLEADILNDGQE